MSKKIILVIAVLLLGGYYIIEGMDILTPETEIQTQPPRTLQERDPNETIPLEESSSDPIRGSGILDFNELSRFDSVEEIGDYRFEMRVGEVYRLQEMEYHYLGNGRMLAKSFSDPEFVTEYRWMLVVGYPAPYFGVLGYDEEGKAKPGRGYGSTVIKAESKMALLRIETLWNVPEP